MSLTQVPAQCVFSYVNSRKNPVCNERMVIWMARRWGCILAGRRNVSTHMFENLSPSHLAYFKLIEMENDCMTPFTTFGGPKHLIAFVVAVFRGFGDSFLRSFGYTSYACSPGVSSKSVSLRLITIVSFKLRFRFFRFRWLNVFPQDMPINDLDNV